MSFSTSGVLVDKHNQQLQLALSPAMLHTFSTLPASCCCRFQFEPDALEVVIAGKEEQQTENAFVGGRNRWSYDSFINWELWWPGFPILVYFKV